MDVVLLDVGPDQTVLGKWDGQSLSLRAIPSTEPRTAWAQCQAVLNPIASSQLIFRCRDHNGNTDSQQETIKSLASSHGIRDIRFIGVHISADPGIAAARYYGERNRIGNIFSAEINRTDATLAISTPREGVIAYRHLAASPDYEMTASQLKDALLALFTSTMSRNENNEPLTLIAFGERGAAHVNSIAAACGISRVIVPDHSVFFSTIGMVLADIVLEFREEFSPTAYNREVLRPVFGRLMDQAGAAITLEGYDLDDAICRRQLFLTRQGQSKIFDWDNEDWADGDDVQIHGAGVTAIITTKKPELNPSAIHII